MAQQEGLERYRLKEKYFDIMLVGMTGQGKTTTADKLLIANPEGKRYVLPDEMGLNVRHDGEVRVQMEDISMWLLHKEDESEDTETHLKALVYFRTSAQPQDGVNTMRGPEGNILSGTSSCQVLSNDTTKVRILDVPGFHDEKAFSSPTSSVAASSLNRSNRLYQASDSITTFNMGITRNIIRIQSALGMCFRRVVYFLPVRGPLERPSALLMSELQQLEFAFGRSVFECMVAVATVPDMYSLKNEPEKEKFPPKWFGQCEKHLSEALGAVLGVRPDEVPKVPIIFISLSESCESILRKVQGAEVSRDHLVLTFNPSSCASCGMRIGSLDDERVTCSTFKDPEGSIPYEESTCHPAFKRSFLSYVLGRKIARRISHRWPSYKEEYCIECKQCPFEPGCLRIGQKYKTWWGKVYTVDHTSEVTDPVEEPSPQTDQPGATVDEPVPQADQSGAAVPPPDDRQELRADQFGGGARLQVPTEGGGGHQVLVAHVEEEENKKGT